MYKRYHLETQKGNAMLTDIFYSPVFLRIFLASKRQKIKNIEPDSEKQYSSKKIECTQLNTNFEKHMWSTLR